MNYPNIVCTSLVAAGTVPVGTFVVIAAQVPTDALGGGLTIVDAWVSSSVALASGSIPVVRLVYTNSGGTILGTIGANVAAYTAGTPIPLTCTETFVDAERYIAWKYEGTAAEAAQTNLTAGFHAIPGY